MNRASDRIGFVLVLLGLTAGPARSAETLDIYFIDVGRSVGNATLIVTPEGQSVMLDCGPPYALRRVVDVLKQASVKELDTLVVSHYHADHYGATVSLAEQVPIKTYVDHGQSVEWHRSDDWWKERRGPWFREGMGKAYDTAYEAYLKTREKGKHLVVKPGDTIPAPGATIQVVCAGGKILGQPLPGAGQPNPACESVQTRSDDDAEDEQSIGVVVALGEFRFIYLADLTWNKANALFCPRNLVGTVDAYLVTHHAQSFPQSMGDYYFGLSACPRSEVHGLHPRVAILSLGGLGHRQGNADALQTVRSSPGLEDLWQTERITEGGEKALNAPDDFIATLGPPGNQARYIKLSARRDGSLTMTNSRNGFSKSYPARHSAR